MPSSHLQLPFHQHANVSNHVIWICRTTQKLSYSKKKKQFGRTKKVDRSRRGWDRIEHEGGRYPVEISRSRLSRATSVKE